MTDSAVTLALIEHRDGDPRLILNENYWSRLIKLSRQRDRVIEAAHERDYHQMHNALDKLESLEKQT